MVASMNTRTRWLREFASLCEELGSKLPADAAACWSLTGHRLKHFADRIDAGVVGPQSDLERELWTAFDEASAAEPSMLRQVLSVVGVGAVVRAMVLETIRDVVTLDDARPGLEKLEELLAAATLSVDVMLRTGQFTVAPVLTGFVGRAGRVASI
jgi:hypothetical protein